jgi:hypothetical protein
MGHITNMGHGKCIQNLKVEKPEGNLQLGRPKTRLVDTINMDIKIKGCNDVYFIHLSRNRDQWRIRWRTVMNLVFHTDKVRDCFSS